MEVPSFFDYALKDQSGKRRRKFLQEMKRYIPYEEIEELLIKEVATTTAKEADIKQLEYLTKEEQKFIYADSA